MGMRVWVALGKLATIRHLGRHNKEADGSV